MIMDYSQKQLAGFLSYKNASHISDWEHGKKLPTLKNAIRLSHILNAPVESLFPGLVRDDPKPKGKNLSHKYS
jgi:transcriptional regulator with XRE-family HTH domain